LGLDAAATAAAWFLIFEMAKKAKALDAFDNEAHPVAIHRRAPPIASVARATARLAAG
jgi:hypothetical protein